MNLSKFVEDGEGLAIFIYRYKVEFVDDLKDNESAIAYGCLIAHSLSEVMEILDAYYGEDNIIEVTTKCLAEKSVIEFDEDIYYKIEDWNNI